MADRTVTVKSSGGDYTSLNAALSGESADLVTNTRLLTIETYAFEDTTDADTGTGYTVSADYYIKITSPESERHAGVWNAAKSRHKCSTNANPSACLVIQESYTEIEWQQFEIVPSGANGYSGVRNVDEGGSLTGVLVHHCIFKRTGSNTNHTYCYGIYFGVTGNAINFTNAKIYRNLIYDMYIAGNTGECSILLWSSAYGVALSAEIYNNTCFNSSAGIVTDDNGVASFTITLKNNYCGGLAAGYDYYLTGTVTSAKNISSDSTSPDGASYEGKTAYTDYFADFSNDDFHLKSTDTVLKDAGDNLGSPYDIDIDGETVTGTWDIGADEYISSVIAGTTCWGHSTGVTETNTRTFASNWTGTGSIENSGDSENLVLSEGQYMESEIVETGPETITVTYNYYASGDSITIKYRTAATSAGITSESWSTYSAPFTSSGYIQLRLEG